MARWLSGVRGNPRLLIEETVKAFGLNANVPQQAVSSFAVTAQPFDRLGTAIAEQQSPICTKLVQKFPTLNANRYAVRLNSL